MDVTFLYKQVGPRFRLLLSIPSDISDTFGRELTGIYSREGESRVNGGDFTVSMPIRNGSRVDFAFCGSGIHERVAGAAYVVGLIDDYYDGRINTQPAKERIAEFKRVIDPEGRFPDPFTQTGMYEKRERLPRGGKDEPQS